MSIILEPNYVLLDTSQLIRLLDSDKIATLNKQKFLETYGFPFLTFEHLMEISRNDYFDKFSKNITKLGSVDVFQSFTSDIPLLPGSVFNILEYEIYSFYQENNINREILNRHIRNKLYTFKLNIPTAQHRELYNYLRSQAYRDSLSFILLSNLTNPDFRKKNRDIRKQQMKISNMSKEEIDKSVFAFLSKRLSKKEEIPKLFADFLNIDGKSERNEKSTRGVIELLTGEIADDKLTPEDLLYNSLFSFIKKLASDKYRFDSLLLEDLKYSQLIFNNVYFESIRQLANTYKIDKERSIESSSIFDIQYLTCSALFKVYVDKRTYELGKIISKKINIELYFDHNEDIVIL